MRPVLVRRLCLPSLRRIKTQNISQIQEVNQEVFQWIWGYRTVRGILQHLVGPGGETTGLTVLLDAPLTINGIEHSQLEIEREGMSIDKLLDEFKNDRAAKGL